MSTTTTYRCTACAAEFQFAATGAEAQVRCPKCQGPVAAAAPSPVPPPPPVTAQADATGGLIPYRNPQALIAYYLGIFGLLPFIGIVLSIPAIVLGILGYRQYRRTPIIKGVVHAWIGICLGLLGTSYNSLFLVGVIVGIINQR